MDSSLSKGKKVHVFFLCALAAVFALQIWKSFQGIGPQDEHCYIALGYRIVKGDALIYDEWHVTQLISLFIAPLIHLYIAIAGTMDGVVLFFRIAYVVFTMICALALYLRFRDQGLPAALAGLVYMLFTPFNIMTLSYNTMSIGFLLLSQMMRDDSSRLKSFLSGILFAWAVLNTPYLALVYIIETVLAFWKKTDASFREWGSRTLGIAVSAGLFFILLFSRASFAQILEGLPHLLDKGHTDSALILLLKGTGKLFQAFSVFLLLFALEAAAALFFRTKKEKRKAVLLAAMPVNLLSAVYVLFLRPYYPELGGHALILFSFAWTGLVAWLLFPEKIGSFEKSCFVLSAVHAFLVAVSSNVGPRSFCSMLITACSMTVLFLAECTEEEVPGRSTVFAVLFALFLLTARVTGLYDCEGILNTRITRGPLAGLIAAENEAELCDRLLADVKELNGMREDNAVFVSYNAWEYLAFEKGVATNSAYINPGFEQEWIDNQDAYYSVHPEKFPAFYYLDSTGAPYDWDGSEPFFEKLEKVKDMRCGILFIRR